MSIVRAVIYFQLLHLIVGLSVDHCDNLGHFNQCLFKVSSTNTQLRVQCSEQILYIYTLNFDNKNVFVEDDIPSQQRLQDMCMHSHNGTTVKHTPSMSNYTAISYVGIKQLPDNYFCDGSTLGWISIANNRLNDTRKLGFSSIANCTTQCLKSTLLDTDNNAFEKVFNNSFCGLEDLSLLDLNNNQIKELERDAFINLKSLTSLELKNNYISVLPPGVFRQQQNTLEDLLLSNNRLNSQSILELKNLKQLIWLYLENNDIDALPNDVFKDMTQLTHLYLGGNLIKALQGSLSNLINLEWLSISANNISIIESEDFSNIVSLKWVNFSINPITTIEPDFCANCDQMSSVAIANASLTTVPHFLTRSAKLKTIDLSNNKIDQINAGAFDAGEDIYLIDLSFNLLTSMTNVFTKCKVKQLKLEHNRLTRFSFADLSSQLITLSITHNNIHTIDTSRDINHKLHWSLKHLYLSHNHLNEIADGSFDHLAVLNVLSLEHNNLRNISENIFKRLYSLTQLFLSHNKIKTIEPNAFPSQLQTLHLDNNQLLNFNVWQLDHLMNLTKLSLSGNQWSCDLSERLEAWLNKKSHIVNDIGKIVCEQPNATVPPMPHFHTNPDTTSIDSDELDSTNEINYANSVAYANVWAWLLSLCACIAMCV